MKLKLVLVVFCFASFFANGQTKVGTINSEFIVGLMPEAKNVLSDLNVYAKKLDSSYQVKLADYNAKVAAFQKLEPRLSDNFKKRFESYGWEYILIDGHNEKEIFKALKKVQHTKNPSSNYHKSGTSLYPIFVLFR